MQTSMWSLLVNQSARKICKFVFGSCNEVDVINLLAFSLLNIRSWLHDIIAMPHTGTLALYLYAVYGPGQ